MQFLSSLIECVISLLTETKILAVVVDPVMVTTHLSSNSLTILRDQLLPVATLITPTRNEAAILLDRDIVSLEDMKRAAQDLHLLGPKYVLVKGDHLALDTLLQTQAADNENTVVMDVLFDGLNFTLFKSSYVPTTDAHSLRCTLSAAITAYLAHGLDMISAVQHAIMYTHSSAKNSLVLDRDNGLLIDKLPDDSVGQSNKYKPFAINEQQEQQKSPSESGDKVVIVSNQCWIHEPRILLQKRSFVQLLKNSCLKEWVCIFAFLAYHCIGRGE
jgi:hydroxymethylpyrimidine kinase/phosphomethylpyrimidine kinase